MDLHNFDCSSAIEKLQVVSDEVHDRVASETISKVEYTTMLEDSVLKTRDILLEMQEASEKESTVNSKRFIVQTVLSAASLIVAAIAAVASIISLL